MNNKQKFVKSFLIITIISIVLVGFGTEASANHSMNGYHWPRVSNPFTIYVTDNVDGSWDSYLTSALNDWSSSSVLDMQVGAGFTVGVLKNKKNTKNLRNGTNTMSTTPSITKTCDPVMGKVIVCNDVYSGNWMGTTMVWVTGPENHITQATIRLNDTYFSMPMYDTADWRNLTMCHELGHTLGLDHQDVDWYNTNLGTCLDYGMDPSTNRRPNFHDYEQLDITYSHLDAISGVGIVSGVGVLRLGSNSSVNINDSSSWGKGIEKDKNGKYSLFEKDLGEGNKVLTHVFWAK
ncbi:hypothetical protein HZA26_02310 [Candidatus Nomurabacteria bacterium]|nr:hypothetical protein [Candidatus Nomurabacteria bacterium]